MKAENFCYWLQGFIELRGGCDGGLSATQLTCVANHLNMVFAHDIDPKMGDKAEQERLSHLHSGGSRDRTLKC